MTQLPLVCPNITDLLFVEFLVCCCQAIYGAYDICRLDNLDIPTIYLLWQSGIICGIKMHARSKCVHCGASKTEASAASCDLARTRRVSRDGRRRRQTAWTAIRKSAGRRLCGEVLRASFCDDQNHFDFSAEVGQTRTKNLQLVKNREYCENLSDDGTTIIACPLPFISPTSETYSEGVYPR